MESPQKKGIEAVRLLLGVSLLLSLASTALLCALAPEWPRPEGRLLWQRLRGIMAVGGCFLGPLPLHLLLLCHFPCRWEENWLGEAAGFLLGAQAVQLWWVALCGTGVCRWAVWLVLLQFFLMIQCACRCRRMGWLVGAAGLLGVAAVLPALWWSALGW